MNYSKHNRWKVIFDTTPKAVINFFYRLGLFFVFITACKDTVGQISVTHLTYGRPFSEVRYVGDQVNRNNTYYYQFEIGASSWNASEVGIGQNTDGSTGWSWGDAIWYQDGSWPNKRVQRDIGSFTFTNAGVYYVVGRAKANWWDPWTYTEESGWNNNTTLTLSTSTGNASYFNVTALEPPNVGQVKPTSNSSTGIDLNWTKWNNRNVIILRSTSEITSHPVNATNYSVNSSIGGATVIYNGSDVNFTDVNLTAGTRYYYAFYSENWGYYSAATTTSATAGTFYTKANTGTPTSTAQWTNNIDGTGGSPTDFTDTKHTFIVQSGHTYTMTDNWTVAGSVNISGTLVLNGYDLSLGTGGVASSISCSGLIRGSSSSSMVINGTGALGTLNFDVANSGGVLNNLTVNRTSSGSVTLGTALDIITSLNITTGTLNTGGTLTLKSSASNTARVTAIGSGGVHLR